MSVPTTQRQKKRHGAKRLSRAADRTRDSQWRSAFAALKKSLRSKRATGYRVATITEDDKYGGET